MSRLMKNTALCTALLATACGGERAIDVSLEAPPEREARITITPALDISGLTRADLAERIQVDDIAINLADVRLLGADPRIPAGGLRLLEAPQVISGSGDAMVGIVLPFPEYLLSREDLAVFVRIDPSAELGGASVLIHAQLYQHPLPAVNPLTSNPDPDGDPADDPEGGGVSNPDPDGDPAECIDETKPMNPDPDGDPAQPRCARRFALVERGAPSKSIAIELRGSDAVDLMAGLSARSTLDVVVGIPAAHWLTEETVAALDHALEAQPAPAPGSGEKAGRGAQPDDTIVVKSAEAKQQHGAEPGEERKVDREANDYFLTDDLGSGDLRR